MPAAAAMLAGLLLAAAPAARPTGRATTIRLACRADTNVSSYPSERGFNYGKSPRLRLKGIEMLMLARFDTAPVGGWKVERARLFLHAAGEHRLKTLGLSTIAVDWTEGEEAGRTAKSGATFDWADAGRRRWGGRQSDFTDASFTRAGTQAVYTDLHRRAESWLEIDVPPAFVEAMARGTSFGIAISDEKGQTRWNNAVDAREQAGFAPYLEVTGDPSAHGATEDGRRQTADGGRPGVVLRPSSPVLRPLSPALPTLPRANPVAWAGGEPPLRDGGLRAWAYGDGEKAHPVSGNLLEEVGAAAIAGAPAGTYRRRNAVWDGGASTIQLAGAGNEFVAFHLCVEAANGRAAGVRVTASDLSGPRGARIPARGIRLFRDWYVRDGEWYPEVALPLAGPFSIPDARNAIAGQRNQSLFVEIDVPHHAPAGVYRGRLEIAAEGARAFSLPVELQVLGFTLPDALSFAVDLNAYGPPGDAETELQFQRMAHEHRATLNILGYNQSGRANPAYGPPLEGSDRGLHVRDWTEFDRRFGRYFDGSAFADLPRGRVPVRDAYLPFCEGWPSDIRQHYRYQPAASAYPALIAEHALLAPPIGEAFDAQFKNEFQSVVKEFARHCREKGWTGTQFQFYLNNKYYYRDPAQGGRGSSWWLLDEPMHRDDWLALRFFGQLFKRAVGEERRAGAPAPQLLFRADVSRPQWQRDWLDGLVDLMCVSGEFFRKNDLCLEMKRSQGITFWHYGTGNDIRATNLTGEAWPLQVFLAGGDGMLPWNSLGGDASFDRPTPTTLLYPGGRFGIAGPLASLRLKALRRGQQDVEYLALLARRRGWTREQLAAAVAPLLKLQARTRERFVDDAGTPLFDRLRSDQLAALRASTAAAVGEG
jgi:hypothetical protein